MAYQDYIRQTPEGYIRVVSSGDYDSIVSYTPLPDIVVYTDAVVNLPNTVEATFKSGKVETMVIKWERVNVDTSTAGTQKIYGDIGNGSAAVLQNVIVNELSDLDILRQIRDANPTTSRIHSIFNDNLNPYVEWWDANNELGVLFGSNPILDEIGYGAVVPPISERDPYKVYLFALDGFVEESDSLKINTVAGINKLRELIVFTISSNIISNVDMSNCTKLQVFQGQSNIISSIDITNTPSMFIFYVDVNQLTSIPTLTSKGLITEYSFTYNNFSTSELDRFRSMGFTDEINLLPQNP